MLFYGCREAGFESDISKNIKSDPNIISANNSPFISRLTRGKLPPLVESVGVIGLVDD